MKHASPPTFLTSLVQLFYPSIEAIGSFEQVFADDIPGPYQALLAHDDHMTVTVEAFHNSLVNVQVVRQRHTDDTYAREILLTRQDNGAVVQYGIVRINLAHVDDQVRREIERRETPLGRILIRHNVLRQVELEHLYRVSPADVLREHLQIPSGKHSYGRTARIRVSGAPAIELLEIVAPWTQ